MGDLIHWPYMQHHPNKPRVVLALSLIMLLGQGCPLYRSQAPQTPVPVSPKPVTEPAPQRLPVTDPATEPAMPAKEDAIMKQGQGTYEPYSKAFYNAYTSGGDRIVLDFYANWCPTCIAGEPVFKRIIEESDFEVHALRVNYNDSDTDEDEKALAKTFGITYQHTFIYLDANGNEINRTIGARSESQYRTDIDTLK